MIIKEPMNEKSIDIIYDLMKSNDGYVTSKQVTELGIHRMYLKIMNDRKIIERVGKGIYIDSNRIEDLYYVFSLENPKVIFSHMTALYFHGLSIIAPRNEYDITVINKYHNPKLKHHNIFYVSKKAYYIGVSNVVTPMGNRVKAYDIERCICDIIRSKKRMDLEHVKYSVKEYLKRNDKDLIKLADYAEILSVKEEVMSFVSMMYE